jgi:hypothetical protein
MKEFTAAFQRLFKETKPERLKRAFGLERAVAARHKNMGMSKPDAI